MRSSTRGQNRSGKSHRRRPQALGAHPFRSGAAARPTVERPRHGYREELRLHREGLRMHPRAEHPALPPRLRPELGRRHQAMRGTSASSRRVQEEGPSSNECEQKAKSCAQDLAERLMRPTHLSYGFIRGVNAWSCARLVSQAAARSPSRWPRSQRPQVESGSAARGSGDRRS